MRVRRCYSFVVNIFFFGEQSCQAGKVVGDWVREHNNNHYDDIFCVTQTYVTYPKYFDSFFCCCCCSPFVRRCINSILLSYIQKHLRQLYRGKFGARTETLICADTARKKGRFRHFSVAVFQMTICMLVFSISSLHRFFFSLR